MLVGPTQKRTHPHPASSNYFPIPSHRGSLSSRAELQRQGPIRGGVGQVQQLVDVHHELPHHLVLENQLNPENPCKCVLGVGTKPGGGVGIHYYTKGHQRTRKETKGKTEGASQKDQQNQGRSLILPCPVPWATDKTTDWAFLPPEKKRKVIQPFKVPTPLSVPL